MSGSLSRNISVDIRGMERERQEDDTWNCEVTFILSLERLLFLLLPKLRRRRENDLVVKITLVCIKWPVHPVIYIFSVKQYSKLRVSKSVFHLKFRTTSVITYLKSFFILLNWIPIFKREAQTKFNFAHFFTRIRRRRRNYFCYLYETFCSLYHHPSLWFLFHFAFEYYSQ